MFIFQGRKISQPLHFELHRMNSKIRKKNLQAKVFRVINEFLENSRKEFSFQRLKLSKKEASHSITASEFLRL